MQIERNNVRVRLLADSQSPYFNSRLTTFELKYPRIIHQELMTHRMFSRNAGSSRARPVSTVLKDDVFVPRQFRKNKSGMQPTEPLENQNLPKMKWELAHKYARMYSCELSNIKVHKQWANRLTEPFAFINVVVSATQWGNFFKLRYHDDAQLEIQDLAYAMREIYENNSVQILEEGKWHLPYITEEDIQEHGLETCKYLSTARCARVSYKPFNENNTNIEKDLELHDKLIKSKHWSPFEHAAVAFNGPLWHGNFYGFRSYRCDVQNINPRIEIPFNLASLLQHHHISPYASQEILSHLEKKLNVRESF